MIHTRGYTAKQESVIIVTHKGREFVKEPLDPGMHYSANQLHRIKCRLAKTEEWTPARS